MISNAADEIATIVNKIAIEIRETEKEARERHRRFSVLKLTIAQNNAIYDCYKQGVSHDGNVWVTWTEVEKLLANLEMVCYKCPGRNYGHMAEGNANGLQTLLKKEVVEE